MELCIVDCFPTEKVHELLLELDTDLMQYLDFLGVSDMAFCHRWVRARVYTSRKFSWIWIIYLSILECSWIDGSFLAERSY